MRSVFTGSELECGEGLGEMCVTGCYVAWFTLCLAYLVVFNTDSSISGSNHF